MGVGGHSRTIPDDQNLPKQQPDMVAVKIDMRKRERCNNRRKPKQIPQSTSLTKLRELQVFGDFVRSSPVTTISTPVGQMRDNSGLVRSSPATVVPTPVGQTRDDSRQNKREREKKWVTDL
ncbi:hypothetical protein Sjap_011253 [Stephania japonica]|uniref:Uncharacterized protein n=1 Tax=Stephania japonica TaxID=461633 RepID=A0AAP0P7Y2_9MAGN